MTIDQFVADIENALHLQLHGWRKDFLVSKVQEFAALAVAASHTPAQAPEQPAEPSAADLDAVAADQEAADATR